MHRGHPGKAGACRRLLLADLFGQLETKTMGEGVLELKDKSVPGSLTAGVTELLLSSFEK